MNRETKKFIKKARADMKRDCPVIYDNFLAHLNDQEFLEELRHQAAQLQTLAPGKTIGIAVQFPDGEIMECGRYTRQNPGNN